MNFTEVYSLYADTVYSYIRFHIKDTYLAEDILQDTFLSVYQKSGDLTKINSVKTWLLSIAHNKMVDRLRKAKNEQLSDNPENEIGQPAEAPRLENGVFIDELLSRLDETSRLIIYGIYVEELTCKEISKILGIPEGTVKSKAYYARAGLRKWLEVDKDDIR